MKSNKEILETKIIEMERTIKELQNTVVSERWLDGVDVKKALNCSDSTLARYRKNNTLPYTKVGSKYLYPESFFTTSLKKKLVNAHLL